MRSLHRPILGAVIALATSAYASPAIAAGGTPYTDPGASGLLTLCDEAAHPIDHGTITAPLATTVVSGTGASAGYNVAGRTATLFAFQPRQGVAPSEWSGDSLSASSRYVDPAHPAAKLTPADPPLNTFLNAYPPRWGGFVELRLFLGAPDQPPLTRSYAAADIKVVGNTWELVRGGASCAGAQATSIEELLPSQDPSKSVAQAALVAPGSGGPSSGAGPGSGSSATSVPDGAPTGSVTARSLSSSSDPTGWLRVAIPFAGFVLAVGFLVRRRVLHRTPTEATT